VRMCVRSCSSFTFPFIKKIEILCFYETMFCYSVLSDYESCYVSASLLFTNF
jgi:hypothetical protein